MSGLLWCEHCGAVTRLVYQFGWMVEICPNQHDGMHPIYETSSTDNSLEAKSP